MSELHPESLLPPPSAGVIIIDDAKRVVFVEEKVAALLQAAPEELIGRHCGELRRIFPCGEESCALNEPCRLFSKVEVNEPVIRINQLCTFKSHVIKNEQGEKLGVVHFVSLSPKKRERKRSPDTMFHGIVGNHPKMQALFRLIELVAPTDVTVHIFGPSGTGKELIADALHALSERHAKRLVKVNCSTIPATLLESALFGHVKGSFTGAHKDHEGFIEYAEGGTLFLDEIGDVSGEIQVKLLRLLQSREYSRVGDSRTRMADLRIITATNRDLGQLVRQGIVREDFFYRINVFPITVPPLAQRAEDISHIAGYFLEKFNKRFSKSLLGFSQEALTALMQYHWPGNVRELEHAIEHAFVKAANGHIQITHLPEWIGNKSEDFSQMETAAPATEAPSPVAADHTDKSAIERALALHRRNVSKAAKSFGVSRVTLWKYMKKFGIER